MGFEDDCERLQGLDPVCVSDVEDHGGVGGEGFYQAVTRILMIRIVS